MSYFETQDRVERNLYAAQSLLQDEPDQMFNMGNESVPRFSNNQQSYTGLQGASQSYNQRSRDYEGSAMGDSDNASAMGQPRRYAGQNSFKSNGGVEPMDVDIPSRRGRRMAGGGSVPSQGSVSDHDGGRGINQTSQQNFTMGRPQTGYGAPTANNFEQGYRPQTGGGADLLDRELSKPLGGNLMSDNGSKYGGDDDMLSQYMGQSELGGASYLGGDFATDNTRPATTAGAGDSLAISRKGSRRAEVAQRHGLSLAGTKSSPAEGAQGAGAGQPPRMAQQKSSNHGIFLGGGVVQEPPSKQIARAKSVGAGGSQTPASRFDPSSLNENAQGKDARGILNRQSPMELDAQSQVSRRSRIPIDNASVDSPDRSDAGNRSMSQPAPKQVHSMALNRPKPPTVSIYDNKEEYLRQKKKEEIDRLERDLHKEKEKQREQKTDHEAQLREQKEKHREEIEKIEASNNQILSLISEGKDKILGTLQDDVQKLKEQMDEQFKADLQEKEKIHQANLEQLKIALKRETDNIERELQKQEEMWTQLEKVKKQTVDLGEIVQGSLRQREDELRRREIDMTKQETELLEEEQIQIELEEKKLEEEERRLQLRKDALLKLKSTQNEEINKLREQRQNAIEVNAADEARHRQEERGAKEQVNQLKKTYELLTDLRSKKRQEMEIDVSSKQTEAINCQEMFQKDKKELEQDYSERHLVEIRSKQIEIEERRQALAENNQQLRKDSRYLEQKRALVQQEEEALDEHENNLQEEMTAFEEVAEKIQQTSQRLAEERELVMGDKAKFDLEKERLDKIKHDLEVQKSLLQSEIAKAREFEHDLNHRENMLNMLKFHEKQQTSGVGGIPAYTSCYQMKQQLPLPQMGSIGSEEQHQQPLIDALSYNSRDTAAQLNYQRRFDYNQYITELQTRLGYDQWFNGPVGQNASKTIPTSEEQYEGGGMVQQQKHVHQANNSAIYSVGNYGSVEGTSHESDFKSQGLRQQIIQKLGNVQLDDSKTNSQMDNEEHEEFGDNVMMVTDQYQPNQNAYRQFKQRPQDDLYEYDDDQ